MFKNILYVRVILQSGEIWAKKLIENKQQQKKLIILISFISTSSLNI